MGHYPCLFFFTYFVFNISQTYRFFYAYIFFFFILGLMPFTCVCILTTLLPVHFFISFYFLSVSFVRFSYHNPADTSHKSPLPPAIPYFLLFFLPSRSSFLLPSFPPPFWSLPFPTPPYVSPSLPFPSLPFSSLLFSSSLPNHSFILPHNYISMLLCYLLYFLLWSCFNNVVHHC